MEIFVGSKKYAAALTTIALSFASLATAAMAGPSNFSFRAVEFMPRDQRQAAAQAFVTNHIPPGMPIAAAEAVVRRAGAYCRGDRDASGMVICSLTSMVAHSDQKSEEDITWLVQLTPDASGAVSNASVRRISGPF
jgi:hypothetical protein